MPAPITKNYGRITVVKRNGQDSAFFELKYKDYLFGRGSHCDVCIQLETIAEEHCRVFQNNEGKAVIEDISSLGLIVNGNSLRKHEQHILRTGDVFTIVERSFRYEADGVASLPVTPKKGIEADLMHFSPRKVTTPSKMKGSPMMPQEDTDGTKQSPDTPSKVSTVGSPKVQLEDAVASKAQTVNDSPIRGFQKEHDGSAETITLVGDDGSAETITLVGDDGSAETITLVEDDGSAETITLVGEDAPTKVNTPVKTNTSVKANTPVKTNTPVKANTPVKTNTPVKANTPVKTNTPVKANTPVKTNTHVKDATPAKVNTPSQVNTPQKADTPNQVNTLQDASTPSQFNTLQKANTPSQVSTLQTTNSPVNNDTPQKSATPQKALEVLEECTRKLGTPQRVASPRRTTPSKVTCTPQRVGASPNKIGSPQRVARQAPGKTPVKTDSLIAMINEFVPESNHMSPSRAATAAAEASKVISTPESQIENGKSTKAAPSSRSVSKFQLDCPEQATTTTCSTGPVSAQTMCTPPPRQNHASSPNVNLLFPPTPALAAVSLLAESNSPKLTVADAAVPLTVAITPRAAAISNSVHSTPRSPRYSVASAGSPIVVDVEIKASPKVGKVEFFERPEFHSGKDVVEHASDETTMEESDKVIQDETIDDSILAPQEEPKVASPEDNQDDARPAEKNGDPDAMIVDSVETSDMVAESQLLASNDAEMVDAPTLPDFAEISAMSIDSGPKASEIEKESLSIQEAQGEPEPITEGADCLKPKLGESAMVKDGEGWTGTANSTETSAEAGKGPLSILDNSTAAEKSPVAEEALEAHIDDTAAPLKQEQEPETLHPQPAPVDKPQQETSESRDGASTVKDACQDHDNSQLAVSSVPSTPRGSTHSAPTKTPVSVAEDNVAATEPRRSNRNTTTPAKTPATSKTGKRTRSQAAADEDVEALTENLAARKSTRKTPVAKTAASLSTAKKTNTTGRTRQGKEEKGAEEVSELDSASPSYRPRRAARNKNGKTTDESSVADIGDDAENAHPNKIAKNGAGQTPLKGGSNVVVEINSESAEEEGRRRSARARTPAKIK